VVEVDRSCLGVDDGKNNCLGARRVLSLFLRSVRGEWVLPVRIEVGRKKKVGSYCSRAISGGCMRMLCCCCCCCCCNAIDVVVAVVDVTVGIEYDRRFASGERIKEEEDEVVVVARRLAYCRSNRPREGDGKGTRIELDVDDVVGKVNDAVVVVVVVVVISSNGEQEGDG
jgi:hypothetical protein